MHLPVTALACTLALACCAPASERPAVAAAESAPAVPEREFDHGHAAWSEILGERLVGGNLDYAAIKDAPEPLERYLGSLETVTASELAGWTREQKMAFWINAYNAYTVKRVVDGYPTKSIKKLGSLLTSVWDQRFIPLADLDPKGEGRELSLNDIEHEILRARYGDARIHAAVNCASASCPPLRGEAFTAKRLDEQLDEQLRVWLADPTRNRFDSTKQRAELSKIFDWYGEDFGESEAERLAWIARYAPEGVADWLTAPGVEVRHLDYDWALNDVPRPKRP